jgi:hypothetical protein
MKKGIIGKTLKKIPPKPKAKKASENVGPLGFKTHQRPEDRPRKV